MDHDFFVEKVWPELAHRVPSFEKLKVSCWEKCKIYIYIKYFVNKNNG